MWDFAPVGGMRVGRYSDVSVFIFSVLLLMSILKLLGLVSKTQSEYLIKRCKLMNLNIPQSITTQIIYIIHCSFIILRNAY